MRNCGYQGHVCDTWGGRVQFISRYRDENDYCIGGHRVTLCDDGTLRAYSGVTEAERVALHNFLLNEYADYLRWRTEYFRKVLKAEPAPLENTPFKFAEIRTA